MQTTAANCVSSRSSVAASTVASAAVGVGVKALYDPRLTDDFVDPRLPIDITDLHTYAVEWGDGTSSFFVDDEIVHRSPQSPTYPMQVMMAVFDFPDWSIGDDDGLTPELVVRSIAGATDTVTTEQLRR